MPGTSFLALVAGAAGLAVVSIGVYHASVVAPRLRKIAGALAAPADASEAASLAVVRASAAAFEKRVNQRLDLLEAAAASDALRIGFLRYNSFSDVGSDQSFTLALLNLGGDGIVLSSIFGREETRTYGKSVRGFTPEQSASKEEEAAIAMARGSLGAFVRA
jgi:hypothetical protein